LGDGFRDFTFLLLFGYTGIGNGITLYFLLYVCSVMINIKNYICDLKFLKYFLKKLFQKFIIVICNNICLFGCYNDKINTPKWRSWNKPYQCNIFRDVKNVFFSGVMRLNI